MARSAKHRPRQASVAAEMDPAFFDRLREQVGEDILGLADALRTISPTSIRVNGRKWQGPGSGHVPWCSTGHYLDQRPAFTFDPLLHGGCYYVQEASSMLLEQAVRAAGVSDQRILALDLCAAPGGKSTHLRSLLHPDSLLVANEVDRKRQPILVENLWKWGASNTVITGSAPSCLAQLPELFDLILVDAPCSGEGMFRKDAFAREQWDARLVQRCAAIQGDVLAHAWAGLKPGGTLVYSTCTWEVAENEAQVARLVELGGTCIPIPMDPAWGVVRSAINGVDALRCYPHRMTGEGFFIAVVRKPGEWQPYAQATLPASTDEALAWLKPDRRWQTVEQSDECFAMDVSWGREYTAIRATFHLIAPGIPLAERKANTWRPHPALALSAALDRSHFSNIAMDADHAIAYLRGEAIPASTPAHGIALLTYRDLALGWLQGAGNRWNNRWPVAWRIRTQHPSAPPVSWAQAH